MGISADIKCCDDYTKNCRDTCPVTAEDIHRVLLEAYDILTDCSLCFDDKKEKLYCLDKKFRCYIDTNRPYTFKYYKDCYDFEYLVYIASVGDYAIDLVVYKDLGDWINLDTGSCVRNVKYGGCSKLQNTVSKRRDLCGKEKELYEAKRKEIDHLKINGEFCYGKNSVLDWRCKPKCEILKPCDLEKVDCKFAVLVKIDNWNMCKGGKHAKVFLGDCEVAKITECDLVYVDIKGHKNGYHTLCVKLYDECDKYIGLCCERQVKICVKKCKKPKKKDNCNKCLKKKDNCGCKVKKWCDDTSSTSTCSSSTTECDSTTECESSVSSVVYNFEDTYSCKDPCDKEEESSSTSCSSSSSSSTEECKKKKYKHHQKKKSKFICNTGKCNLRK